MNPVEIIRKKRDGLVLTAEELDSFISGFLGGDIPDYQAAAFLMAAYLKGLDDNETAALTDLMLRSGKRLDLAEMESPVIDKHSTGGVGDKVSIVLAPMVAALEVVVPMISGRALGHTGGTLDKLESIPGFRTNLSFIDFRNALWEAGLAMIGQTDDIAPADRRLYALRDVTATVESIPLITASIMSKKLAEGLDGLVLDVKTGKGAFMKDRESAEALAMSLVETGRRYGVRTIAVITSMDEPIGRTVGNSLEVRECINFLKGRADDDLLELVLTLGSYMLFIAEECVNLEGKRSVDMEVEPSEARLEEKRINLEGVINSGKALEKFVELLETQGGNPEIVANPGLLPVAGNILPIEAPRKGYITGLDAEKIGVAAMLLGAGRLKKDDPVDPAVGITLNRKTGEDVDAGDPVAVLHYNDERNLSEAKELVREAFSIGDAPPEPKEMIIKIIT